MLLNVSNSTTKLYYNSGKEKYYDSTQAIMEIYNCPYRRKTRKH